MGDGRLKSVLPQFCGMKETLFVALQTAKKVASVVLQSPLGGEITPKAILEKVPADAEKVYVRIDQNKAYWVKGEDYGSVDLW